MADVSYVKEIIMAKAGLFHGLNDSPLCVSLKLNVIQHGIFWKIVYMLFEWAQKEVHSIYYLVITMKIIVILIINFDCFS